MNIKQRIAEAIKPFWGNYIIGRDVCQLLQDCLKHIEELEKQLKRAKRPKRQTPGHAGVRKIKI